MTTPPIIASILALSIALAGARAPLRKYYALTFYPPEHKTKAEQLRVMTTDDGINFFDVETGYAPASETGAVRNPAVLFRHDRFWLAHSDASERVGWSSLSTHISFASSSDGTSYTPLARPDFSNVGSFGPNPTIWAGNWFVDADDSVHYIFGAAAAGGGLGGSFEIWETHPTTPDAFGGTWSTPLRVTGTAINADGPVIDPYVARDGSNYYLLVQNHLPGVNHAVRVVKSTAGALSGYDTLLHTGNWNGFSSLLGTINDQPLIHTINGSQIMYTDHEMVVYYAIQKKGDWKTGGPTTWSPLARAVQPEGTPVIRAGSIIPTPRTLQ